MNRERKKLRVIHDEELEGLLSKLGLLDDIKVGKRKCKFCENVITLVNIHSLFPESGQVSVVCDHPECVKKLMIYLQQKDL